MATIFVKTPTTKVAGWCSGDDLENSSFTQVNFSQNISWTTLLSLFLHNSNNRPYFQFSYMYNSTQAKAWDSLHWADDLIGTGCEQPHILTPHSHTTLFTFSHHIFHILTPHCSHSHTTFFTFSRHIFHSPPSNQNTIVIFVTSILSKLVLARFLAGWYW